MSKNRGSIKVLPKVKEGEHVPDPQADFCMKCGMSKYTIVCEDLRCKPEVYSVPLYAHRDRTRETMDERLQRDGLSESCAETNPKGGINERKD